MPTPSYAELLCRSNFSFLRGASHPEELLTRADALGYQALAIADLDGVYGLPKAYWKGKTLAAEAEAQGRRACKLIHGAELSLERVELGAEPRRAGLVLLARDRAGWSLLCRLLTASHAGKPKGTAGLEWDVFLGMVQAHPGRQGLCCLPRGEGLGQDLESFGTAQAPFYPSLKSLFGPQQLWVPLTRHLDGGGAARTQAVRALARTHGLRALAAGDVHYHEAARRRLQDALACVREGVSLAEAGWRLFPNAERHLKPAEDMARLFHDWPELLAHGLEAAESCAFSLAELKYRYPAEWIPEGRTSQSHLEALA
ncbi:MAG TPA: PHP domain-containing protein, partial [bacterium]|nr:PHP domain-containing protein [bacterium]